MVVADAVRVERRDEVEEDEDKERRLEVGMDEAVEEDETSGTLEVVVAEERVVGID